MSHAVTVFVFTFGLFLGMLLFLEIGRRIAVRRMREDTGTAGEGVGAVDGAVFALLGLLIAFTFSGASSRFDTRRQLIVEETNDIGTAYLRLDLLPADGLLLPRPRTKEALVRQLRDYFHQVCHSLGLPVRIVPHQLRHTYATEMLRSGVSLPAVMKLLGHSSPDMTLLYLHIALPDLQREFHQARSHPRHLIPQPKTATASLSNGPDGLIQSMLASQHLMEMFRRSLPPDGPRLQLCRLANRLTKLIAELRTLTQPGK